ncbi:MAG: class II fructose-bisphosphate aldolase [Patescibacteria group bacterium]|nr:class II fructose-bisphosphate aldolase [Patescibacteria group bacterium]
MIVSLKQAIEKAEKNKVAIGHFNVSNFEQLKAIANVAQKLNVPVIIGVSEGERDFIGVRQIVALVKSFKDEGFAIFLNSDHTHTIERVREAALAGFDAVLFDGAKLPFEENIKLTKEAIKIVKSINPEIIIEGELGYIGGSSMVFKKLPKGVAINEKDLTKPEDAKKFIEETGVDLFAPAVGNVHGMLKNAPNPNLNIERIREIKKAVKIPLVLHGGSGISDEDFHAAIDAGISIIHISTELRVAWRKGLEEGFIKHPEEVAPYKLAQVAIQDMTAVVENRLKLFNRL